MISYLKGRIKFKGENFFILENNGIGYQIFASSLFIKKIKEGQEMEVFTYLCFKQDITIELYGFQNTEEMDFFKKLNSVSGIGPKSALGILSIGSLKEIENAIASNDLKFLTQVSGVGKKTAERLVFELKNKIKSSGQNKIKKQDNQPLKETLMGLGYKNLEIDKALDKIPQEMENLEDKIKFALKLLGKK